MYDRSYTWSTKIARSDMLPKEAKVKRPITR